MFLNSSSILALCFRVKTTSSFEKCVVVLSSIVWRYCCWWWWCAAPGLRRFFKICVIHSFSWNAKKEMFMRGGFSINTLNFFGVFLSFTRLRFVWTVQKTNYWSILSLPSRTPREFHLSLSSLSTHTPFPITNCLKRLYLILNRSTDSIEILHTEHCRWRSEPKIDLAKCFFCQTFFGLSPSQPPLVHLIWNEVVLHNLRTYWQRRTILFPLIFVYCSRRLLSPIFQDDSL